MVSSYARLAEQFEVIVIERAGGAAEVNLRDRDIMNWRVAELADAPVLIVADIDKGGALASLVERLHYFRPRSNGGLRDSSSTSFAATPHCWMTA